MNGDTVTSVSPGLGAFLAFFALAIALWLLMRNMNARMRRMSYRAEEAQREAEAKGAHRPAGESEGPQPSEDVTPVADDEGPVEGQTDGTKP